MEFISDIGLKPITLTGVVTLLAGLTAFGAGMWAFVRAYRRYHR